MQEGTAHQHRLQRRASNRAAGYKDGQAGRARETRAVADALERYRSDRWPMVFGSVRTRAAAKDDDRLSVAGVGWIECRRAIEAVNQKSADGGHRQQGERDHPDNGQRAARAPETTHDEKSDQRDEQHAGRRQQCRLHNGL
jgi:hypothetical protein